MFWKYFVYSNRTVDGHDGYHQKMHLYSPAPSGKILVQNRRRRKDVVGGSKTGDKQTTSSDKTADTSQTAAVVVGTLVVVVVVVVVGQRVGGSGSGGPPSVTGRLFHTYDMVAPPNKVTPTAFLNTAANRFHHSHNTSAFSSPRDARTDGLLMSAGAPRFPWEGLEGAGFGQQMSGAVANDLNHHHHHANAARGLASMGMGLGSVGQSPGVHGQSSPLLSDPPQLPPAPGVRLSAAARDSAQAQSSVLGVGGGRGNPSYRTLSARLSHHNGVALPTPSLAMNRVLPVSPFIADLPIMRETMEGKRKMSPYNWRNWYYPQPPKKKDHRIYLPPVDDNLPASTIPK
nr:hypothetical protein BaRGS_006908 [Batillaria attramentaria]